jgi:hypothetical protein
MRQLRFVGVAEDGTHLVLQADATGDAGNGVEQFLLPVDERLRVASRGDRSRLGQIEIELESTLRPKEIQARIRAGETPEEVAAAANVPVDRVLRFAYPVLQEREQVTIEARRTRIRRSDSAQRLGAQVEDRLSRQGVDPSATSWDAYRREDGTWWLTLSWRAGKREQRAQWAFDLPGRTLTPADDLAAELQAEQPKKRSVAAVPFVPEEEDEPPARPAPRRARAPRRSETARRPVEAKPASPISMVPSPEPDDPPEDEAGAYADSESLGDSDTPEPSGSEQASAQMEQSEQPGKAERGRKPKVPSWDDIVFGTRGGRG